MRVDFAAVCDYALVDQYGKLSVLGIFSHIWVGKFPTIHPRLHLVLHLKGRRTEIGEHHVRIRLLDEADAEVLAGDGAVTFAEPPAGVTEIAAAAILVFDVPFAKPGRYRFQIELDGALTTEMPITVAHGPGTPSPRPRS